MASVKRSAADYLPAKLTLPLLRDAARGCKGCELYKLGTQTVFGEGPKKASLMLVGETPGDQEDLQGRPFVGPAGRLLDETLARVGIERGDVYVTNAVKHFKWEPRGKRRLHKKPNRVEVVSCRAWLESEILVVKPRAIVCLGATAAQSLLGPAFRITKERGRLLKSDWAPILVATHHPSAVLRAPAKEDRDRMRGELAADLARVMRRLRSEPAGLSRRDKPGGSRATNGRSRRGRGRGRDSGRSAIRHSRYRRDTGVRSGP